MWIILFFLKTFEIGQLNINAPFGAEKNPIYLIIIINYGKIIKKMKWRNR